MAKVKIINKFPLLKPRMETTNKSDNVVYFKSYPDNTIWERSEEYVSSEYRWFPVVLDNKMAPWPDGCCFLLSYLKGIAIPDPASLENVAFDLQKFKTWCEEEDVDYKAVPTFRAARATYKFVRFLSRKIENSKLSKSTGQRVLSRVVNFYRWMSDTGRINGTDAFFLEKGSFVPINSFSGRMGHRSVNSTDLSIYLSRVRGKSTFGDYIIDGRKLRPHNPKERAALRMALRSSANTEVKLAVSIAISTGARLGTVLTLRKGDFVKYLDKNQDFERIRIGGNSLTKNKKNKSMVLLLPRSVYNSIVDYLRSDRYLSRLSKSKHKYRNGENEFVFLSDRGKAYYVPNFDPGDLSNYKTLPRGGVFSQMVKRHIQPVFSEHTKDRHFNFHDLRATFGLLLLDFESKRKGLKNLNNQDGTDFFQILNIVRERLGHEKLKTTVEYIKYYTNNSPQRLVQQDFEDLMLTWLDEVQV